MRSPHHAHLIIDGARSDSKLVFSAVGSGARYNFPPYQAFAISNYLRIGRNLMLLLLVIGAIQSTVHGTFFLADHSSPINQNSTFSAAEESFIDAAMAKHEADMQNLTDFLQIKIYEGGQVHKKFIESHDCFVSSSIWNPDGTLFDTEKFLRS